MKNPMITFRVFIPATAIILGMAAGSVFAQQPQKQKFLSWQGFYLSLNRVSPIRQPFKQPDLNVGLLGIIGVEKRCSIQIQYLQPITGPRTQPLVRISFDVRLF